LKLSVKSTVIDWRAQTMEVTDTDGRKHTIPLSQEVTATMIGYPERVQKTMWAGHLDEFITKGYIIEEISFEETPAETEPVEDGQQHASKQPPDIDLEHIASMWPAAMAMATKMRRDEEVELEHSLAALVRGFLAERGAISEEQRELVQMEIHPTDLAILYHIAYVRPGAEETPEHPRLLICTRREDGWHLSPMPHEPF
jgi:hypothetical protein